MKKAPRFQKLLEPIRIGEMSIRNRIVMPAMVTNYGTEDGHVTQRGKDYYEERAIGGAGLIIVESCCVDLSQGKSFTHQLAIDDNRFIPGLSELAQAIKRHGARAALQLQHAGSNTSSALIGSQPVAPSPIAMPGCELPKELAIGEIADIIDRFAQAAERAKKAGFDGVEIHAAHGYLIAQFLSSARNRRKDGYGGELKNRARFLLEIVSAIRGSVGRSYPVWCRINGEESGLAGGNTINDAQELARMLEGAGVNAINVSAISATFPSTCWPMSLPQGWAVHLAEGVKKVVNIPVMAVGRITSEIGERILHEEKTDLILMGRAHLADPELVNKIAADRLEDIVPCIACNTCIYTLYSGDDIRCTVNAALGREQKYRIKPVEKKRRVLIAGSGPAGMQAATTAALRGHEVILYEKGHKLGGQLLLAATPPHKGDIESLTRYLTSQVEKLEVMVEFNTKVTPALVEEIKPDVFILASGATPLIPEIPGVDRDNVVTAEEVLADKVEVGAKIIVLGGGMVGCETAEFLAERARKVTIIEMLDKLASDVWEVQGRQILIDRLAKKGVNMVTEAKGEEITDRGLVIVTKHGERLTVEMDTLVLAAGFRPNIELYEALQEKILEFHRAGDCVEPQKILEAIHDASRIARDL
jgi:2,4-dienoyl-CoA reductase-like NADH-dependent reductase (Old Yellow Enzyme family)/thioredoxin reductase